MKQVTYILLGCGLLAAGIGIFVGRNSKPAQQAPAFQAQALVIQQREIETRPAESVSSPSPVALETTAQQSAAPEPIVEPEQAKASPSQPAKATAPAAQPKKKPPIKDPVAREALALVGADPEAELYWYSAINDFSLSAHERQDLIEDLNEDGLSDPAHPTIQDLPLILSRIDLIENVGPETMDPVNAAAFQEAYKDLVNLARVAASGGQPE